MKNLREQTEGLRALGYNAVLARAKVAHDIILMSIARSGLEVFGTIKGGVVMSALTGDIRRATMDMDIDFIHHPISDAGVRRFVSRLDKAMPAFSISTVGGMVDLKHADYRGKRIFLLVRDASMPRGVRTKLDIGVHTHESIRQVRIAFDVASGDAAAELQANSKEQIFAEKLLSLLRHGVVSNRPKDIYDLYYLSDKLSMKKLRAYIEELIYNNPRCRANDKDDVCRMLNVIFSAGSFRRRLSRSTANWMQTSPDEALDGILRLVKRL